MAKQRIRIVTDGAVDLKPDIIDQFGIYPVPRGFQIGRALYESGEETPLRILDEKVFSPRARVKSPTINAFLGAYRRFRSDLILSLHAAETLDDAARYARLARNMLSSPPLSTYFDERGTLRHLEFPRPTSKPPAVTVFEATTIDLGMTLLVTIAARAAQEGLDMVQIDLLLHLLQNEMVQTFVLTKDTSRLGVDGRSGQELVSMVQGFLSGAEALLQLDRTKRRFTIVEKGRHLIANLAQHPVLRRAVPPPCNIWIRHRGYAAYVEALPSQFRNTCRAEQVSLKGDSLAAVPYFSSDYVELVFGPTYEQIGNLIKDAVMTLER